MRILALAHIDGRSDFAGVAERCRSERIDVVTVAGGLLPRREEGGNGTAHDRTAMLQRVLSGLADLPCTVAVVPGEHDAPERLVLQALVMSQWATRGLHCVHGMFTVAHELAVVGFGGRVRDDDGREVVSRLEYPGWEAEYRIAVANELDQRLLLVFHHPHAEAKQLDVVDGQHTGSRAVTEMIGTWRPRVAVVGGMVQGQEIYGDTMVVSPGAYSSGQYAVVDEHARDVALV
ncbi:MAG TPA: hypothetical protein VGQ42_10610 [Candidatus Dormibacteraeota bacterium]|jgi:Icc-related predicted phosphoesterase|nr:hypothetical protein [Candidatus Dormibacteraeota bacterium]